MADQSEKVASTVEILARVLGEAARTPEGAKILVGHDEDYQFDLEDGTSFYVSIANGGLSVHNGHTPKTGYYETTFIETDGATLQDLVKGKLRPVDAIEENRFRMVIRMYEGCQITILLRIAGDLAIGRLVAAA